MLIGLLVAVAVIGVVIVLLVIRRATSAATEPKADAGLKVQLSRTRSAISASLAGVLGSDQIADEQWEAIEDALIAADVGPDTSADIVERVRADRPVDGSEAREALIKELEAILADTDRTLQLQGSPAVVLVVGVNGTGKTTSIAKIANRLVQDDTTVVLGAADTFRAAADAQLREWGSRVGVSVVSGAEGADPASVAHDAVATARADGADVVIIDTAGRLHNQRNLLKQHMQPLRQPPDRLLEYFVEGLTVAGGDHMSSLTTD